jgi:putative transcriptional regulator
MSGKPRNAEHIFNDIYLISSHSELSKVLRAKPTARNFRVYLGYTGWGPGQLEHEMELGAWRILPGDDESVFDADPSKVWPRLIERTEMRFVLLFSGR